MTKHCANRRVCSIRSSDELYFGLDRSLVLRGRAKVQDAKSEMWLMNSSDLMLHLPVSHPKGVRLVAMLEAFKGLLVILAGLGLLALVHVDLQAQAEAIIGHFHLNPGSRYPRVFLDLTSNLTDARLWTMATLAFAYASIRLIEAGGLWFHRLWAEWLAALSGAIYVPFELYELTKGITGLKLVTLAVNLLIVGYMTWVLMLRLGQIPSARYHDKPDNAPRP